MEIGGRLVEPRENGTMTNVTNHAKSVGITKFWLGIHDKNLDGSFVYASDNSTIDWSNWALGQSGNNSTGKNCVQVTDSGKWSGLPCEGNERSPICMRGSKLLSISFFS